jgi:hypothetical protein
MDDIIVLILTLIFIVAGIFGQMKKRQLPPDESTGSNPVQDNFWENIDEEDEHPIGVTEHLQPVKEVAKEDRFHTTGNQMRRDVVRKPIIEIPKKPKVDTRKLKRFPLKKAVIYSEILYRKYF